MNGDGLAKSFGESPDTHVQTITANVTSQEDWKKVVDLAKDKFGGVDILVNNAGQYEDRDRASLTPTRYFLQEQAHSRCH